MLNFLHCLLLRKCFPAPKIKLPNSIPAKIWKVCALYVKLTLFTSKHSLKSVQTLVIIFTLKLYLVICWQYSRYCSFDFSVKFFLKEIMFEDVWRSYYLSIYFVVFCRSIFVWEKESVTYIRVYFVFSLECGISLFVAIWYFVYVTWMFFLKLQ